MGISEETRLALARSIEVEAEAVLRAAGRIRGYLAGLPEGDPGRLAVLADLGALEPAAAGLRGRFLGAGGRGR
jgi:hypothetical protein